MGQALMNRFSPGSDAFFLGLFLELKLEAMWFRQGLFRLVVRLIDQIRQKGKVFSNTLKDKMIEQLKVSNPVIYQQYFKLSA